MREKNGIVHLSDICNQYRKRFLDTFTPCICLLESEDGAKEEDNDLCRIWYRDFVSCFHRLAQHQRHYADRVCENSACISSIVRLVYSVRMTRTHDTTWVVDAVLMWGFAEFTTVILAGALPTIPRLIQWLRERKGSPPYAQSYQNSPKPAHTIFGDDLAELEVVKPGRGMQFATTTTRKSYIPLEEDLGRV